MTTCLPLELEHLYACSLYHVSRPITRRNPFALVARLQSSTTTASTPSTTILHPPQPPGSVHRWRGGLNLGAYPQVIDPNDAHSTHNPNAHISLASPPAFTSFQDTPKPGDVPLVKDPPPAQLGYVPTPGQGFKLPPKRVFKGIELPERPKPPASDECCMGGCAVCVYDLYGDALEAYHADLALAREKLSAAGVPEEEWPDDVAAAGSDGKSAGKKAKEAVDDEISRLDVSLKAFLAMERALKKKRVGESEGRAG